MDQNFAVTARFAFSFWEALDNPTSLGLALAARSGDYGAVLSHSVKAEDFLLPEDFHAANAACTFLKKNPDVPGTSAEDRKRAALESFLEGEKSCYHANERLSPFLVSPLAGDPRAQFLRMVRATIASWLGRPPGDDEVKSRAKHGPGTTFSSIVRDPTAADKYDDIMSMTSNAVFFLANLVGTKWGAITASRYSKRNEFDRSVKFVRGGRHATVPKTALTDRNILVEPSVNIYFQLAYGSAIRARLRRSTGWDLDHAADIHRRMAREASITGSYSTLDLSNASDTICRNLVKLVLRDTGWLEPLEDLRSPVAIVQDRPRLLEKFSSMGNGYTFELETVLFAAIVSVCTRLALNDESAGRLGEDIFVFGDDIICPTRATELVAKTLSWLGFTLNPKKSFTSGPFRESCGSDFFDGYPVRGIYVKDRLSTRSPSLMRLHNKVKRLNIPSTQPFMDMLFSMAPPHHRLGGDERLGDSVFHGRPERYRWEHGIKWVRILKTSVPRTLSWVWFSEEARIACRLTGYGHSFGIDTRGGIPVVDVGWVSGS